ncbi:hypothetical protein C8Q76DRAFT_378016 [Earliella scabrosa]|nr:hypothetical protein C8Q76DRAFT_378016 [Earliella scabrosa]
MRSKLLLLHLHFQYTQSFTLFIHTMPGAHGQARNAMPRAGRSIRNALYSQGRASKPSLEDKIAAYERMQETLGPRIKWYTQKVHLTWCSGFETKLELREKKREAAIAARAAERDIILETVATYVRQGLQQFPDPPLSILGLWAAELKVPRHLVCVVASSLAP